VPHWHHRLQEIPCAKMHFGISVKYFHEFFEEAIVEQIQEGANRNENKLKERSYQSY